MCTIFFSLGLQCVTELPRKEKSPSLTRLLTPVRVNQPIVTLRKTLQHHSHLPVLSDSTQVFAGPSDTTLFSSSPKYMGSTAEHHLQEEAKAGFVFFSSRL